MEIILKDCLLYDTILRRILEKYWGPIVLKRQDLVPTEYIFEADGFYISVLEEFDNTIILIKILGVGETLEVAGTLSEKIVLAIRRIEEMFYRYSTMSEYYNYPVYALIQAAKVKIYSCGYFSIDTDYKNCTIKYTTRCSSSSIIVNGVGYHFATMREFEADFTNNRLNSALYIKDEVVGVKSARKVI
jgi:hypothetical protein